MGFIAVYITHPSMREARRVVNHLLEKRLIACANLFPVKSLYRWKGRVENSSEVVSIVKTRRGNWSRLKSEVGRIHGYEVPCIMKLNAEANDAYERWVESETKRA